jgi:hypothetical protein
VLKTKVKAGSSAGPVHHRRIAFAEGDTKACFEQSQPHFNGESDVRSRLLATASYAMGMSQFRTYHARFDDVRSNLTGLPPWARTVFGILILPGIVLVGLSILAVVVSIAALLFLAIPVYMLLRALTASPVKSDGAVVIYDVDPRRIEARRVDARVVDQGNEAPDEVNGE